MASEVPSAVWLAAGAAGWRRGHDDVREQRVSAEQITFEYTKVPADGGALGTHAADAARAYVREALPDHEYTPAQQVRLLMVYMHAYVRGARDEALDAGALDQRRRDGR